VAGGWKVIKVYADAGISGAKGRDQRPGLDAMMKAVNAKEFDMVATWSVDRLGRSVAGSGFNRGRRPCAKAS
jgi:DNA invertase Pin-like site-specific DNA recombinase